MDPDELMRELAEKMGESPALFGHTMAGMTMSARDAEALEASLQTDPDDLDARAKLLAYYSNVSATAGETPPQAVEHIRWLIENAPGSEIAGSIYAQAVSGPDEDELHALWRLVADEHPEDPLVQANAARFFSMHDARALAQLHWERARALDPALPEELPALIPELEHLQPPKLDEPPRQDRPQFKFYELTEEVEEALARPLDSKLKAKAEALLHAAEQYRDNWNYGNAVFHAHTALGLSALADGDLETARRALLQSASTTGSPQLKAFGPKMILAERLLEAGDRETVLAFLDLCAGWWASGRDRLDAWRRELIAGRTPDFG